MTVVFVPPLAESEYCTACRLKRAKARKKKRPPRLPSYGFAELGIGSSFYVGTDQAAVRRIRQAAAHAKKRIGKVFRVERKSRSCPYYCVRIS